MSLKPRHRSSFQSCVHWCHHSESTHLNRLLPTLSWSSFYDCSIFRQSPHLADGLILHRRFLSVTRRVSTIHVHHFPHISLCELSGAKWYNFSNISKGVYLLLHICDQSLSCGSPFHLCRVRRAGFYYHFINPSFFDTVFRITEGHVRSMMYSFPTLFLDLTYVPSCLREVKTWTDFVNSNTLDNVTLESYFRKQAVFATIRKCSRRCIQPSDNDLRVPAVACVFKFVLFSMASSLVHRMEPYHVW